MLYDVTLPITREILETAGKQEGKVFQGHLGTHFDVMNKDFPLSYCIRSAVLFDVTHVPSDSEISVSDIDIDLLKPDLFVGFVTGFIEKEGYGSRKYFKEHPQLSFELIDLLLQSGISLIGVDFAGVRRGKEHTPTDQRCADQGTFIIENLYGLGSVPRTANSLKAYTFPMRYTGQSGLPCRVVLET
ncbi:MAG: cyclase family protein [Oscillospiraceae bacterium]|nr:cyclase family protein [Oscillospiraceae bacterium]